MEFNYFLFFSDNQIFNLFGSELFFKLESGGGGTGYFPANDIESGYPNLKIKV